MKSESKPLSALSEIELKGLRKTEIDQLKKRFPKRIDVDNITHRLIFKVTDPDWVKELIHPSPCLYKPKLVFNV